MIKPGVMYWYRLPVTFLSDNQIALFVTEVICELEHSGF